MSLTKKQNSGVSVAGRPGPIALASLLTPRMGQQIGSLLAKALRGSMQDNSPQTSQNASGGGSNRRRTARAPKRRGNGWNSANSGGTSSVSPLNYQPTMKHIKGVFSGSIGLGNNVANQCTGVYALGFDNGLNSTVLSFLSTSDQTILKAFTYFRVGKVSLSILPTLGFSASGYTALGYQDNMKSSLTAALNDVTSCAYSVVTPAFSRADLNFTPKHQVPEYFLNDVSQDVNHRYLGYIRIFATNSAAQAAQAGLLNVSIELDVW